jgi:acetamidase/formamidase
MKATDIMAKPYRLPATAETVHWGYLDSKLPPVLRIKSGDRVIIETISGTPQIVTGADASFEILPDYELVFARHQRVMGPHILTGPIFIKGARPGDTLEVRILDIQLRQNWGFNLILPLNGTLPEDFRDTSRVLYIPLDRKLSTARMPWGAYLPLAPFFGVLANAPPSAYGQVTSLIPREFGGNLDNKELRPGTILFLPVFNEGALFSVGDGHAAQGDGEVCTTAIETALQGTFELTVRKDVRLQLPRAETATHYLTMAFDVDLDDAAKDALRDMLRLLGEKANLSREDAYTLVSLAGDVRVTQLVNGNKGIHVMVPKSVLPVDSSST